MGAANIKYDIEQSIYAARPALEATNAVSGQIANGGPFFLDDVKVLKVESKAKQTRARFKFLFTGEKHQGETFSRSKISGEGTALIDAEGEVSFEGVSAERTL